MANALMLFFAGIGLIGVFEWSLAGLFAEIQPGTSLAQTVHRSPVLIGASLAFMSLAMLITALSRPAATQEGDPQ